MLENASAKDLKVAIVGGGLMGHALAAVMLAARSEVWIYESNADLKSTLVGRINCVLAECGKESVAKGSLHIAGSLDEIHPGIELAIEAIPEDLARKRSLFQQLEVLLPKAVLATNSSVYRVQDVSSEMTDPSSAIGTHWWNPPHLIPVVEVIQGVATPALTVDWVMSILREAGKTPIHVRRDTAGFIGNRLQHALWREALALVEEGVASADEVDMVARNTLGMKLGTMGPLENADYVGLDLTYAIHDYLFPTLSRAQVPSPLLLDALAKGRHGAKSGAGLLDWPEGRRAETAARVARYVRRQLLEFSADPAEHYT